MVRRRRVTRDEEEVGEEAEAFDSSSPCLKKNPRSRVYSFTCFDFHAPLPLQGHVTFRCVDSFHGSIGGLEEINAVCTTSL